jgi:iron complex transport system substrate-binding protein
VKIYHFAVIVLAVLLLTAPLPVVAEGVPEPPAEITVEDSYGRTVELAGVPSRIVLAGRATIMLVDALYLFPGVSDRVVAVGRTNQGIGDFFPVLDESAGAKRRLGRSAGAEEILAADPDLVILKSQMRRTLGTALENAGATVLYLDLETPEQYARDIRILGTVLEQQARAEEIVALFEERAQALREATEKRGRPEVLVLSYSRSGEEYSFRIAPESWIQTDQVRLGGGQPIWTEAAASPGWNQIEFEQIAAWDPEVVVLISYRTDAGEPKRRVLADELWAELEAVRNGRVYAMPSDYYSWGQPDTRWILGAEWMAYALHPALFDEPFEGRIRAFFADFYGIDGEEYRADIAPRLSGDLFE